MRTSASDFSYITTFSKADVIPSEKRFILSTTFCRGRVSSLHHNPGRRSCLSCPGLPIFRPYWAEPLVFKCFPILQLFVYGLHFIAEGLLRFVFKNKVLKPYPALLNLRRDSFIQDNNLITLFTKYYHEAYIELRFIKTPGSGKESGFLFYLRMICFDFLMFSFVLVTISARITNPRQQGFLWFFGPYLRPVTVQN